MSDKQKHLSDTDRVIIQKCLEDGLSFKAIGRLLGKDCTTVSKEIRKNSVTVNKASIGRIFNVCIHAKTCEKRNEGCSKCTVSKDKLCRTCTRCIYECEDFIENKCVKLSKPPYVCNGCNDYKKCTISKKVYQPNAAYKMYKERLSESRSGMVITEEEIKHLNDLLVPLIKQQGQSIHHVYINHSDEIMMSEKKLYSLIDQGILAVRNIDLPRKIRYRPRRKKPTGYKVDKRCLEGRRYEDFIAFMESHPGLPVVEMDSVEGKKGESCLLTIHFTVSEFMIGIKREYNDSLSVTRFFNGVYKGLGRETFMKLFPVILTDNGSEFSNPKAIEFDENGERRTYVFYCHPSSPYEKGACEVNHELLRRIVPKGISFNQYERCDISKMMSHINSYSRKKLNDKSPYLIFTSMFSKEIASFFEISCVEADDIKLKPSLISK